MDARAQASERVGALVADKYRLHQVLGVGGMGAVYEALHVYTDRRVAVKLLHPAFLDGSSVTVRRFMLEAKAAAAIQHPSVVEVLDAGEADGVPYVVFELLNGETLSAALLDGHLNQGDLLEVVAQVLEVLDLAHQRGIVHRDIKPENIFLCRGEGGLLRAKVLDFGIARRLDVPITDALTQRGAVLGTPYYMSPEQMTGGAVDARADVWGVGAVLFRGLTGRVPFDARDYAALLAEVFQRGAPPLSDHRPELPEGLRRVVDRALSREVGDRWTSAGEMRGALAPFMRSRPSMVPAPIAALVEARESAAPTAPTPPLAGPSPTPPLLRSPRGSAPPQARASGSSAPPQARAPIAPRPASPAPPLHAAPTTAPPLHAAPTTAPVSDPPRDTPPMRSPPLPRVAPAQERSPAAWERALGEIEGEIEALRARTGDPASAKPSDVPDADGGAWLKKLFGPKRGRP